MYKILAVNPGSTSTKISVAHDTEFVFVEDIKHPKADLIQFEKIADQYEYRKQHVLEELKKRNIPLEFNAVVGRGGLAKPVPGGVFHVNKQMIEDQKNAFHQHACNLGCMLAYEIAALIPGCQSFIADPGVVDELVPEARITGIADAPRVCIWHALNQKAVARRYAKEIGSSYEKLNLIICHMGGGISFAAHQKGKAIDANNALNGEGPFSPERAGSLPLVDIVKMCYRSGLTEAQMLHKLVTQAGVLSLLGTNDMRVVEDNFLAGDEDAVKVLTAMAWNVSKAIASEGAVLYGKVDAIILTGGLCYCKPLVDMLKERLEYLAPIVVYPGQDEMLALTENAIAALSGEQEIKEY